ncbi:unnamed protein product [Ostreobium quekettii]|uniref:Homeobox domain-containing protein n=1 Tax=Ostreobium quekettii TaxID=121088 RepID=A0A8S1IV30_9CHLO|nr:unnamed protein product [Ostreobium quekettii]|eukprot:evm.model.scf_986.2 EVM.evm.TU.scf_986.2   scf_986:13761-17374(+)
MVNDETGLAESQELRSLSGKDNQKATSLVIEPPRPGHAFGQVVRAECSGGQMPGSWGAMQVGGGAVVEPAGDSLDHLYHAWKSDGAMETPFTYETTGDQGGAQLSTIPSSGGVVMKAPATSGCGVMLLNNGRLNTVTSANLQVTHSGGVVSPHAASVDSDKSSSLADVEMLLPQTPLQKPERKRGPEIPIETVEQMAAKGMLVRQYQGAASGVMFQAKRMHPLDAAGASMGSVDQSTAGGYLPASSLQFSAALVPPNASHSMLLDNKQVLTPASVAYNALYGQQLHSLSPRTRSGSLGPIKFPSAGSVGEMTGQHVQFGIAQMPGSNTQAVAAAQAAVHQSQAMSTRSSALEAVRSGILGSDNLVRAIPGRLAPIGRSMQQQQVFSGLDSTGLPSFSDGYGLEDSQDHTTPKRRVQRKRENLPKESTALLKQWLLSHMLLPYPGNEEKLALCRATNLDMAQINNWFINARVRIWKPLVQKVFDKYEPVLKKQAEEEKDEQQLKRIHDARKSSTLNMITLLSGLPEARKELDEIASKSKALSKDG